jgi:alkanesulfonate monooxygenase SsuD/methylene tetrahydromethanopterin reductase-like flavin-dependent oxidoreductase (luciferase family)
MEFGLMQEFQPVPNSNEADSFAKSLEQIDAAERLGLDVIWVADIHFAPQLSVMSSPLLGAAAIAGRTSRIKIGTAVQILALHHPLRVAEDVATLDHLSAGRFIFGVGRSNVPDVYRVLNVPYEESRTRLMEALQILKRAWAEPVFSHRGAHYEFRDVALVPKPFQKPYPPIRMAVESHQGFVTAGKLGYPIFVSVRLGSLSDLVPLIRSYREAYRDAGHPGRGETYLRVPIYIAETARRAHDEARESIMSSFVDMAGLLDASANVSGAADDDRRRQWARRLRKLSYDDALREQVVVGDPESVIDRLAELRERLGLSGVLADVNRGGKLPHDAIMNSLKLLCLTVAPRFR